MNIAASQSILGKYKLHKVLAVAEQVRSVSGDAVEMGVYQGGVLRDLAKLFPDRTVWGYDSFEGLPSEDWAEDEVHSAGDFADTSMEAVAALCSNHPNVRLVKGHIPDSLIDARFAFAHVDLDFYRSTMAALTWLLPRMNAGGSIVLDDFGWPRCPGVERAVSELGLSYRKISEYQACLTT